MGPVDFTGKKNYIFFLKCLEKIGPIHTKGRIMCKCIESERVLQTESKLERFSTECSESCALSKVNCKQRKSIGTPISQLNP